MANASSLTNADLLEEVKRRQESDYYFAQELEKAVLGEIQSYVRNLITRILEQSGIKWSSNKINQAANWVMDQLRNMFGR